MISASKVGLLEHCQAFPRLEWTYTTSAAADRGTRFHSAIEAYTTTRQRVPVDKDIAEEYSHACDWIDALQAPPGTLHPEVAMAWDPSTDTASILTRKGRDYSEAAGRLPGTADLIYWVAKTSELKVWDWKTGDASKAGPQLRALGLMASRAYGASIVRVAALEVRADGVTEVGAETLDEFALADMAGSLGELLSSVADAPPSPGEHCSSLYCPARLACPLAGTALSAVESVIPAEQLVRRPEYRITDPIKTPEHAIYVLDVIRLVNAWLDAKKDEIKSLLPADGWRTQDGRVLREGTCEQSAFDRHKATALLKQLGATTAQIASVHYTFTKSTGLRVSGGTRSRRQQ